VAFLCNTRIGLTAVSYYGGRTMQFLHERPRAPLLMHFGASDPIIPPDDMNKTIDHLPQAEVHIWPAGHGFNCEAREDFNADVAKQALERTLSFFGHHLRGA
jgi:carboxymethylenebutenolidase